MGYGKYAPWEQFPKNLRWNEIQNPLSVLEEFFSSDDLPGHKKELKEWRKFVVSGKFYNDKRHGPGNILYTYEINVKLVEASHLLLLDYKNDHLRSRNITATEQLQTEKESWEFFPENLSEQEELDPFIAIKKAFKKTSPQEYRNYLYEWLHASLVTHPVDESVSPGEVIAVYENLLKLHSAAWLIHQRNPERLGLIDEHQVSNSTTVESAGQKTNAEQEIAHKVFLREVNPVPTAAEKLGLKELKPVILKACPYVEMIVHLGISQSPFTYYLLVLYQSDMKTPEHEIANKIEDNCRQLGNVFVLAHKTESAVKGIEEEGIFWNMVMPKGYLVYQASELILPEYHAIPQERMVRHAQLAWERWGTMGTDFLEGAKSFLDSDKLAPAAFLLHQACESTLVALIKMVLGYRKQTHSLSRLLKLTQLFTDDLKNAFELETTEGAQLFSFLQAAYTDARYKSSYQPDRESVSLLITMVDRLQKIGHGLFKKL